ncbi:MAG: hypothetical protein K0Q59_4649 [Paenibacillus sp.]|jgi:Ca-activated chloride channel family protein|nr:hypothetical protein [Paenibacillus sp.]
MKQIVLITDGYSNEGISPAVAAAYAQKHGVIVNVIGIVNRNEEMGERGAAEISDIALAGGGMSRIVNTEALAHTVQMMTRKTVMQTIQQTVQQQLKQLIGPDASLTTLAPERRGAVVRMIDDLSETSSLRVALLIDTSASMRPKLKAVEEACRDLLASLRARSGQSEMCVMQYPGHAGLAEAELLVGWTNELAKIDKMFYNLNMKGTTPTGPAIMNALHIAALAEMPEWERTSPDGIRRDGRARANDGDGILSDYIV